ncbi:S8 family peptidase [Acetobacter orientalis]|uniref:S8 family peptidase n=1 Tax=Acetobacter orientalis TaxID=146474 RepID=UPI0020A4A6DD|nr:S8 family peptidase [Acetobacter orientalis]MCP1220452.1 S8 family peptidase [Acetobacter orientalis]
MTTRPSEVSPDRALVFEVIGPVAKFIAAVRQAGLEWLTEAQDDGSFREEGVDEEDAEADGSTVGDTLLYVTMPTIGGLQRVLALWNRYVAGEPKPTDDGDWWSLFGYLSDLRTWSARDRVDPVSQAYVNRMLERYPDRPVRLELDLWFREASELRESAKAYVEALMDLVGGEVLDFGTIEPICYQAALVELPSAQARQLVSLHGPLANADKVMRVRPQSFYTTDPRDPIENPIDIRAIPTTLDEREPVAALLDGYPVQNHALLANRVDIEEVDVTGAMSPVTRRQHGTAMASLIIHGDLASEQAPISRLLKVVPVLAAPQGANEECTPPNKLPILMVYRAVRALVVGLDGEPLGRRVVVINHSVCDQQAPFVRGASPWAKLLDYLAHQHDLLFVVSAGNCNTLFNLDSYVASEEFENANVLERQVVILRSIENAKGTRSLLSPAEAVNALTVGAVHEDAAGDCPIGHIEPFSAGGVTNIGSGLGLGINRAIKPEVVEAGGRQLVRSQTVDGVVSIWGYEHADLGQLVAAPDPVGGSVNRQARMTGTSNAAALLTRSAIKLVDVVEAIYQEDNEDWNALRARAVILKALLVHGARWGETGTLLNEIYSGTWQRKRENISRFLGFGRHDLTQMLHANGSRITLLADDVIASDGRHEYRIPIPRDMIGNRELRRIVLTLAWSTPIDPNSVRYRGVICEIVDGDGKRKFWNGVKQTLQPHPDASRRGTLQHLVLEGNNLVSSPGSGEFTVGVQCRAQLTEFVNTEVPYALAVTLELAQPVRTTVYEDVRTRIKPIRVITNTPIRTRQRTR